MIKVKNLFNNIYYFFWLFNFSFILDIFPISFFISINSLLIKSKSTWILFLSLFFVLYKFVNIPVGLWNFKCSLNNPWFLFFCFSRISLLNSFTSCFGLYFWGINYFFLSLSSSYSWNDCLGNEKRSSLNALTIFFSSFKNFELIVKSFFTRFVFGHLIVACKHLDLLAMLSFHFVYLNVCSNKISA